MFEVLTASTVVKFNSKRYTVIEFEPKKLEKYFWDLPAQEVWAVVAGLLFDERHDLGRLVADHGEQRGEVHTGDAVQPVNGVDGERLPDAALQRGGAQSLQPVGDGGVELER